MGAHVALTSCNGAIVVDRFLHSLLAIVGGVFAVAGMVDSTVYQTIELAKKVGLGKAD